MQSKMKKRRFPRRLKIPKISSEAANVLKVGFPFIITALVALTIKMQDDVTEHPVTVLHTYPAMYEYIFASLTLLVLGAVLFDVIAKNKRL